jgi:hypothetical protein
MEIASDVHEQVAAGLAEGMPQRSLSRAVRGRALRGALSDVAWRIEVEWARDGVLTGDRVRLGLSVLLVCAVVVWDAARGGLVDQDLAEGSTLVVRAVAALLLALSLASLVAAAAAPRGLVSRARKHLRRAAVGFLSCSFAAAVLWRDAAPPFDGVAAAAWALFGVGLVLTVAALVVGWVRRRRTGKRLALRKISS